MRHVPQTITDFATALDEAHSCEEVSHLSRAVAREHGFDKLSYHAWLRSHGAETPERSRNIFAFGYPQDWREHYESAGLNRVDPITRKAREATLPFLWSDVRRANDLRPRERAYLRDMDEADLGEGIALQTHGPNLRSAYVGLGFCADAPSRPSRAFLRTVSAAAHLAHLEICRLDDLSHEIDYTSLSPRETEVLRYLAHGLSSGQVANVLEVSPHTIDALQRRIFLKLDVTDRTSAVVRGLVLGLIDAPRPRSHAMTLFTD